MVDAAFIYTEYNLSTPFDISTRLYAGDAERCELTALQATIDSNIVDMVFSSDGLKFLLARAGQIMQWIRDSIYRYDLTHLMMFQHVYLQIQDLDSDTLTINVNAGDLDQGSNNKIIKYKALRSIMMVQKYF